ncbi:MAG: hypothetical protein WAM28_06960 [Chlamydiales bacterium]
MDNWQFKKYFIFRSTEERYYEGCLFRQLINTLNKNTPLFVIGDPFHFQQMIYLIESLFEI